jgi:DNA-binding response OmpR family regulator
MKNLVIVDDEREMEDFYQLTFEDEIQKGLIKISFYFDSRKILNSINEGFEQPHLIICDINLPYLSGIELIKSLRNQNISVPVFFVSGYDEYQFEKELKELSIKKFITKPINFDILKQEILNEFQV